MATKKAQSKAKPAKGNASAPSPPEVRNPKRVAVPSIRGYWYQVLHTVRAWLELDTDEEFIVAEGNEDIDRFAHTLKEITEVTLEQVKYRSTAITTGDEMIGETVAHYLIAFASHHKQGARFRGILRTNAEIRGDDTALGKWLAGKPFDERALFRDLKRFLKGNKDALDAFKYVRDNKLEGAFLKTIQWAAASGDLDQLEDAIGNALARRAPMLAREVAMQAVLHRLFQVVTVDQLESRVLRRLDVDLTLNNAALDSLQQTADTPRASSQAAVWSEAGPPSIAIVVFFSRKGALSSFLKRKEQEAQVKGRQFDHQRSLQDAIEALDYVAYGSIRRLRGPRGERVCLRDVLQQAQYRHTPTRVAVDAGKPNWIDDVVQRVWPGCEFKSEASDEVAMARVIANAVATRCDLLNSIGSKLRWVHQIDDGQYFTAENPLPPRPSDTSPSTAEQVLGGLASAK